MIAHAPTLEGRLCSAEAEQKPENCTADSELLRIALVIVLYSNRNGYLRVDLIFKVAAIGIRSRS